MTKVIFPACYLPPVSYMAAMAQQTNKPIWIEQEEHYPKQTYRNRTTIYGANGALDLIIPVKKGRDFHTKMKDVRISYDENWQRLHWLSIQTAYRSSAYFEFYEQDFERFYIEKLPYLLDFNMQLTELLIKLMKIPVEFKLTEEYVSATPDILDYRELIHPKMSSPWDAKIKPYRQVFSDRFGFINRLSVIDLLFNMGPYALSYLSPESSMDGS